MVSKVEEVLKNKYKDNIYLEEIKNGIFNFSN